MKKLYKPYKNLVNHDYIPLNHCVVCYRSNEECKCNEVNVMRKLNQLRKELNFKLKIQNQ